MLPVALIPLRPNVSIGDAFEEFRASKILSCSDLSTLTDDVKLSSTRYALNCLLYLLGDADIITEVHPGLDLNKKKHRNKPSYLGNAVTVHTLGKRLGESIRRIMDRSKERSDSQEGTHASPCPHIRSAHFHKYYVGVGRTETIVHLLATIVVNGIDEDLDELLKRESLTEIR